MKTHHVALALPLEAMICHLAMLGLGPKYPSMGLSRSFCMRAHLQRLGTFV